jgi:RHS repeat-associated protein
MPFSTGFSRRSMFWLVLVAALGCEDSTRSKHAGDADAAVGEFQDKDSRVDRDASALGDATTPVDQAVGPLVKDARTGGPVDVGAPVAEDAAAPPSDTTVPPSDDGTPPTPDAATDPPPDGAVVHIPDAVGEPPPDAVAPPPPDAFVPLNLPPVAAGMALSGLEDETIEFVLAGSDPEGEAVSFRVVSGPDSGALVGVAPFLTYRPSPDAFGPDRFEYVANDGVQDSEPALVVLEIEEVCDAPVARNLTLFPQEGTSIPVTLLADDPDIGERLVFAVSAQPTLGGLRGAAPDLVYDAPPTGGLDAFEFSVDDLRCGASTGVVSLRIGDVDDPPSADARTLTTDEDTPLALQLTGLDPDGADLVFRVIAPPAHGVLEGDPPDLVYVSEADFHGEDTFDFVVHDGALDSPPARISITVAAVNDPPVIRMPAPPTLAANDTALLEALVTDDGDAPGGPLQLQWYVREAPGLATFAPDDAATTRLSGTTPGTYVLALAASDGVLGAEETLTVTVSENRPNRAPTVDAGADAIVYGAGFARLNGVVRDDGRPLPVTAIWSVDDGPGEVVFADETAPTTDARFTDEGLYLLRLTADDGAESASDVVVIDFQTNVPPRVDAGPDRVVSGDGARFAALDAAAQDDGDALTFVWSLEESPAPARIDAPTSAHTFVELSTPGDYRFRVTVDDGRATAFDEVVLTLAGNLPPVVTAGDDVEITLPPRLDVAPPVTHSDPPEPEWRREFETFPAGWILQNGLAATDDRLWVGFAGAAGSVVGDVPAPAGLVAWDDCRWEAAPEGLVGTGRHTVPVAASGTELIAGGFFEPINGSAHNTIVARHGGQRWESNVPPLQIGYIELRVASVFTHGTYYGGYFDFFGQQGVTAYSPARFHNGQWHSLAGGVNGSVWSIVDDGVAGVYVGGGFLEVGGTYDGNWIDGNGPDEDDLIDGVHASMVAHWDGEQWHALGGDFTGCDGFNCTPSVLTLHRDASGALYAGGNFHQIGGVDTQGLSRMDAAGWQRVGGGLEGVVRALAEYRGDLYIGGGIRSAGGRPMGPLARWDGHDFFDAAVDFPIVGDVRTLATFKDSLFLGGVFYNPDGSSPSPLRAYGVRPYPALECPAPVIVNDAPVDGAAARLTARLGHRCAPDTVLTITVDDEAPQVTHFEAGQLAPARDVVLERHFAPGVHRVVLVADDGLSAQSCATTVIVNAGVLVALGGQVTDDGRPDGTLLSRWTLVDGPVGSALGDETAADTQVVLTEPGSYRFRLTGDDGALTGHDDVVVHVTAAEVPNRAPQADAGRDRAITPFEPGPLRLTGRAQDDDLPGALTVRWAQVSGPGVAVLATPDASVTDVRLPAPGVWRFAFTADDGALTSTDEVEIVVRDIVNAGPTLTLAAEHTTILPDAVTLSPQITDDGWPRGFVHTRATHVAGPGEALFLQDGPRIRVAFDTPGDHTLRLEADDGLLQARVDTVVHVFPAGTAPPSIEPPTAPADGAVVTAPVEVIGTAMTELPGQYRLERRPVAEDAEWQAFGQGAANVVDGRLGVFDPTTLANGAWLLRIVVTDGAGRDATSEPIEVTVEGALKPGQMRLAFLDLDVPVGGLPLRFVRLYDSTDSAGSRDFGPGWRSVGTSVRLERSSDLGGNWYHARQVLPGAGAGYGLLSVRHRGVRIVFSDGRVLRFDMSVTPETQPLLPIADVDVLFEPQGETRGSLRALANSNLAVSGSIPGLADLLDLETGAVFNPTRFEYTSLDGVRMVLSEGAGLESLDDGLGNVLTFGPAGLASTRGPSLSIERAPDGRIERLTDPRGESIRYTYDARRRLAAVTDRNGATTRFTYAGATEKLLDYRDPQGVRALQAEFGPDGRLSRLVGPNGETTQLTYEPRQRIERTTDPLGGVTEQAYDERGNVTRRTDPLGHATVYTYDEGDRVTSVTDPLGHVSRTTFDAFGNVASEVDPTGAVRRLVWDVSRLRQMTDALGHTTLLEYAGEQPSRTVGPDGAVEQYSYDRSGTLQEQVRPDGTRVRFAYDAAGRVVSTLSLAPDGTVAGDLRVTYDEAGREVSRSVVSGGETQEILIERDAEGRALRETYADGTFHERTYDANGRVLTETDPLGRRTTHVYDARGREVETQYPDGAVERRDFDVLGRVVRQIDALGQVTGFRYDALGRLIETQHPDGAIEHVEWDAAGRRVAVVDGEGRRRVLAWDAADRLVQMVEPSGATTRYTYDAAGHRLTETDPLGRTRSTAYDTLGQPIAITEPDGSVRRRTWDALRHPATETDEEGRTWSFAYDGWGRLSEVVDPALGSTRYTWTGVSALESVEDALGRVTTYETDSRGRAVGRTLPSGLHETWSYDAAGQRIAHTDAGGETTTWRFDARGRLLERRPDPRSNEVPAVWTWDAAGRRVGLMDGTGFTRWRHDARGRVVARETGAGTVEQRWDLSGRVSRLFTDHPQGLDLTYEYDEDGRLARVEDAHDGTTRYTWDAAARLSAMQQPNGVQTTIGRDLRGRVVSTTARNGLDGVVGSFEYTLSPAGRRLSVREDDGRVVNWRHDPLDRLLEERIAAPGRLDAIITRTWDAVGNLLARDSTAPGVESARFVYDDDDTLIGLASDARGNLLGLEALALHHDSEHHLTQVGGVEYGVDGEGHRVSRTVAGETTYNLIAEDNPTGWPQVIEERVERNGELVPARVFPVGLMRLGLREVHEGGDLLRYFHLDATGSVRRLTDESGEVTDRYAYSGLGEPLEAEGDTVNPWRFHGEAQDLDTGLIHLRARDLVPELGRFTSRDLFDGFPRDPRSLHKYLFANGNGVDFSDPSGHSTLSETAMTAAVQASISFVFDFAKFRLDGEHDFKHAALEAGVNACMNFLFGWLGGAWVGPNAVSAVEAVLSNAVLEGIKVALVEMMVNPGTDPAAIFKKGVSAGVVKAMFGSIEQLNGSLTAINLESITVWAALEGLSQMFNALGDAIVQQYPNFP